MPEREPLPPGILPNVFDTDPPPLNPATEVGDGYVRINQEMLKAEQPRAKAPSTHDPESHPGHPGHQDWLERVRHFERERAASHAQERAGKH